MTNIHDIPVDRLDEMQKRLDERKALKSGGEPPYDGSMEARVAKIETAVEFIQRDLKDFKDEIREVRKDIVAIRTTDFRIIFSAIIFVSLGLAGLMAKGFGWL